MERKTHFIISETVRLYAPVSEVRNLEPPPIVGMGLIPLVVTILLFQLSDNAKKDFLVYEKPDVPIMGVIPLIDTQTARFFAGGHQVEFMAYLLYD